MNSREIVQSDVADTVSESDSCTCCCWVTVFAYRYCGTYTAVNLLKRNAISPGAARSVNNRTWSWSCPAIGKLRALLIGVANQNENLQCVCRAVPRVFGDRRV